ncbi:hypothetical protein J6TS7_29190 [Paenibacillus dendritiformis]|uniref:hypothetical protein n=1 Tax=Paenibacillus TaxID=44249 RepID=UPI001B26C16C|nr:hypothetical protein [Paenibacillus dendritiformis]GIO79309.1 hypothetical protein J6TS7_29190 [Paenibacillus dendritiformis]
MFEKIIEVAFYIPTFPPEEPRDYFAFFWYGLGFIILFYNIMRSFKHWFIDPDSSDYSGQERPIPRKIKKSKLDKWNNYM